MACHTRLSLATDELPNGEVFGAVHNAETGELLWTKVLRPKKHYHCDGCRRKIERNENVLGRDGRIFCASCA